MFRLYRAMKRLVTHRISSSIIGQLPAHRIRRHLAKIKSTWSWPVVVTLALSLVYGAPCSALEFSADRITRIDERIEHTHVYYRDDMWRIEHDGTGPVHVTIVRKDRDLVWHLLPVLRRFKTMRFDLDYGIAVHPTLKGEISRERIGTQMLDGHATTLYEVSARAPDDTVARYYQWVATDINFSLKLAKKSGDWAVEYRHVKIGHMSDYYFQLPRTYAPLEED
jgi:hypothetical protein